MTNTIQVRIITTDGDGNVTFDHQKNLPFYTVDEANRLSSEMFDVIRISMKDQLNNGGK